ncbi:PREDICTED: RNA-binding protein 2-like [Tarenaya hassleriana]|uniref:RNA-binding protein 2-like n=1 Tax=Tarenaya hassleriana TaxID=28532 RepID=UPI00053C0C6D|nr:PREDICTED: RNA-binding protein 2-like [Tarenaya hassleriana]
MNDGYWSRQQRQPPAPAPRPVAASGGIHKRPRNDYDLPPSAIPPGREVHGYMPHDDDHGVLRPVKDTKSIDSAYDLYLQNTKLSSSTSSEANSFGGVSSGRPAGGGRPGIPPMADSVMGRPGFVSPDLAPDGPSVGFGGRSPMDSRGRPGREGILPLPPDASNTLYVEGLPPDCKRREVAHIFRPFVGYREVRLVNKEDKHRGGDTVLLCFVDFETPACAATAMSALRGYQVDETDPESKSLRLQFSRNPGPRSSSAGHRGKR